MPPPERLARMFQIGGASAVYGSGMWTPLAGARQQLEGFESLVLRQMVDLRKAPDEEWVAFYRRRRRATDRLRQAVAAPLWDRALRAAHLWHGHMGLARSPTPF